jgi:hypothetical protein
MAAGAEGVGANAPKCQGLGSECVDASAVDNAAHMQTNPAHSLRRSWLWRVLMMNGRIINEYFNTNVIQPVTHQKTKFMEP